MKAVRNILLVAVLDSLAATVGARAAELAPSRMPVKAPPAEAMPAPDWAGFYVGAHFGYATGRSDWAATGAAPIAGSLNFYTPYDASKGTGSFFSGLHGGYNLVLPLRLLLGLEADVSFPNTIAGSRAFAASGLGVASYGERMETFGTLRARLGQVITGGPFGHWLVYATGGFAWSYDRFTREQFAGTPFGGVAVPGTVETVPKMRTGYAAGVGAEVPVAPQWTARLEYLFIDFGAHGVSFTAGAQRFSGDLDLHTLRLGLNYRYDAKGEAFALPSAPETDIWAFHGQTTYVSQYATPFRSPYRGQNSLVPNHGRETWDVTLYGGIRLWQGAEFWINPEIDQGFGLSGTFGVAGFPSGEAYKVGETFPYTRLPRMFLRQTVDFGGESQKVEANANQFAGSQTADRLVFTVGKLSVGDVFDTNKYAHDPRTDFLNWAVVDTGTFDYAADAWAYTYGATAEWYQGPWALRLGVFDMSVAPNSTVLDPRFSQFQLIAEIERRYEILGQPGKIAATGFLSRGRLGRYADATQLALLNGGPADITAVRRYTSRTGLSFNLEQQIAPEVGFFARAGVASPNIEPYEFTDIDRTVAAGFSLGGPGWSTASRGCTRPFSTLAGLAS